MQQMQKDNQQREEDMQRRIARVYSLLKQPVPNSPPPATRMASQGPSYGLTKRPKVKQNWKNISQMFGTNAIRLRQLTYFEHLYGHVNEILIDQIVACLDDKLTRLPAYASSEIVSRFKITNSALQTLLQERISLNDQIEQKIKEYASR